MGTENTLPEVKKEEVTPPKEAKSKFITTPPPTKPTSDTALGPPPFKIETTGDLPGDNYLNIIIYGKYGTGKTYLAATAQDVPEMQNVLYIEADGGNKVIKKEFKGRIDQIDKVRDYATVARIHEFLTKHCYLRDKGDKAGLIALESWFKGKPITEPKIYNTVILDTVNSIQNYCMEKILGIDTNNWKLDAEPVTANRREWGKDRTMINWMITKFRDLPMNAIFVCAVTNLQDEAQRFHIQPNLPGKLANEVQGFVDHVGYYIKYIGEDKKMHRRIYFEPTSNYQAKNRWHGWEGIAVLDPTMAKLYALEKQYG